MLSRVAAVKAPRTHNRRRVTGSSGRRREGRESEPQRPNMSWRVFTSAVLLLFVLMMCCGSCEASAAQENNLKTMLFRKGDSFDDSENKNMSQAFDSFRAPSLVVVNGLVVAIVEAHYTNSTDKELYVGLVAKSMTVNEKKWTNGTAIVFDHYDVKVYRLLSPTSIVDNGDIKAVLGGYGKSGNPLTELVGDGKYWTSRYASGQIFVGGGDGEEKEFGWDQGTTSKFFPGLFKNFKANAEPYKQFLGGGGAGIRMEDDSRYVLPIQALKHDGKKVSLVALAEKSSFGWEFSDATSDDGCIQPAVLEWEDGDLVMMTSCEDGSRRVYWSSAMGSWWMEEYDTLSRVWGNSLKRTGHGVQGGFVSATIDGQRVILVSQPVYSEKDKKETGRLHLWLTDMQRIYDVGPISAENENVAASTLLYAADEVPSLEGVESKEVEGRLHCSYEVAAGDGKYNIAFLDLTEKLKDVKKVLAAWKEKDAYIVKEYGCTVESNAKRRRECGVVGELTKGLVGFLSSTSNENTWMDEYLGVNATITKVTGGKVTSTEKGVKFRGAWAEWPVGRQGQNQLYHFANYKFTLVATVSIHEVPEGGTPIPLLGVKLSETDSPLIFGLFYTHDKKWMVAFNGSFEAPSHDDDVEWKPNTKYHVALHMDSDDGLMVYVDGKTIYDSEYEVYGHEDDEDYESFPQKLKTLLRPHGISHFYIGGDGKSESGNIDVTVSNVLLYNRALKNDELKALTKADAVGTPEANVSALKGAPQSNHASETLIQSDSETFVIKEVKQDATSSQQRKDAQDRSSEEENKKTAASATYSDSHAVADTKRREEQMEKAANDVDDLPPPLSPAPEAASGHKSPDAEDALGVEHPEQEEESLLPIVAGSTVDEASEMDEAIPQSRTSDDPAQQTTLPLLSEGVDDEPSSLSTSTSNQRSDREEKEAHSHAAVGTNSGLNSSNTTEVTTADVTTATSEPKSDPTTVQREDDVSDDVGAAPDHPNTEPGERDIQSESNAAPLLGNEIFDVENITELLSVGVKGDSTVQGCVSRMLLLLLLLGLWGTVALC
ncbi:trans-sialidase, putative [Trypanosoma cruzi]|uniref:Trans-sialidase, putative n=1 Tax=Trypanosoma cruzi (strain CL Brener) TaxID=353153 RepID=Q4D096_TRYCC|nr:trans-sialidase, putative [Trypanosoma cruzi]EAN85953.1 trans-sialidase, putative [Trypanosoma cruzi]|eukprot:XP_807804.1 trans-sialidase [Trypanosoma cruzi strain CL Brener]